MLKKQKSDSYQQKTFVKLRNPLSTDSLKLLKPTEKDFSNDLLPTYKSVKFNNKSAVLTEITDPKSLVIDYQLLDV